jgi:hypothetical protein
VFEAGGIANLVEQFLGSWFHRFPPVGFDLSRHLPYNFSMITLSRKGPGLVYYTEDFHKYNFGSDLGGFRLRCPNSD